MTPSCPCGGTNAAITNQILDLVGRPTSLIQHVPDRPGHDRRYRLDTTKLRALGWTPQHDFMDGLRAVVEWYRDNDWWWRPIKDEDQEFRGYYEKQYGGTG